MGLLVTGNGIGAFFATFLMGYLYDITGNYNFAFKILMVIITISAGLFLLAFVDRKR